MSLKPHPTLAPLNTTSAAASSAVAAAATVSAAAVATATDSQQSTKTAAPEAAAAAAAAAADTTVANGAGKLVYPKVSLTTSLSPGIFGDTPEGFYQTAQSYWASVEPTMDAMLGGFSVVDSIDVAQSAEFMALHAPTTHAYALDCGAGIGRVTKHLLLPRYVRVDMAELTRAFLDKAKEFIGDDFFRVGECFCVGLQSFIPPIGRYDVIWIQWVAGQLTDLALVGFLQRCARALCSGCHRNQVSDSSDGEKDNTTTNSSSSNSNSSNTNNSPTTTSGGGGGGGTIFIKENVTSDDTLQFDAEDSSYTRPRATFLTLFASAGLQLVGEAVQTGFPESLYPVHMFALKPISQTPGTVVNEHPSTTGFDWSDTDEPVRTILQRALSPVCGALAATEIHGSQNHSPNMPLSPGSSCGGTAPGAMTSVKSAVGEEKQSDDSSGATGVKATSAAK